MGASAYGFQFHLEAASLAAATQRVADTAFNNFLDLIGRPNRRMVLPSRGMPARAKR